MIRAEGWMSVQELHQRGMNVSAISRKHPVNTSRRENGS
jgi:hypothetical protein